MLTKTNSLRMWCSVWSPSGSLVFPQISCTYQYSHEAPPHVVAASYLRPSENQYSCILASQPPKASRVYIFSVIEECPVWLWPPHCFRSISRIQDFWSESTSASTFLGCQSLCHLLCCDHNIIYIHNYDLLPILYLPNTEWSFSGRSRPNS